MFLGWAMGSMDSMDSMDSMGSTGSAGSAGKVAASPPFFGAMPEGRREEVRSQMSDV